MTTTPTAGPMPLLPRYILDGEPVSLKELLAVNDLDSDVVVKLRNLPPGQSLTLGGAIVTREALS